MKKIAVILFLNALCLCSFAGTRRALVIGIGEYEDPAWGRIHGDRDAGAVAGMLRENGFRDLSVLVGREATKAAIVAQFELLAGRCETGDTVYVHFSGHGQLVTDVDGDESDGWDESWIPYDACRKYCPRDHGERHLCDDEINVLLTSVRERIGEDGLLAVSVDACHAGDSTRRPEQNTVVRGVYDGFVIPLTGRHRAARRRERWLTLSACRDYQLNQELPDGSGRLSAALCTLAAELCGLENDELLAKISEFYNRNGARSRLPQAPIMTGETDIRRFSDIFVKRD